MSKEFSANEQTTLTISVIIHTRNEERNIVQCLESCANLPAELIVADMMSTDRTVKLALDYGAKVLQLPLVEEFDSARNASALHTGCEWVLYLDADERLTPSVIETILTLVSIDDPAVAAYSLPFKVFSFDKWIQHAGNWWPSYKSPPLLRRGRFFFPGPVHMPAEVSGQVVRIAPRDQDDAILHLSHPNLTHYFEKLNRYTSLEVLKREKDAHVDWRDIAISFGETFHWFYDATDGKRDGSAGFYLSLCSSLYEVVARLKSAEIEGLTDIPDTAAEFLSIAARSAEYRSVQYPPWFPKLAGLLVSSRQGPEAANGPMQSIYAPSMDSTVGGLDELPDGSLIVTETANQQTRQTPGEPIKLFSSGGRREPYNLWFTGKEREASLRAAIIVHQRALEVLGGGEVQVFQTVKHLRRVGVHCDIYVGEGPREATGYDLLHYFSLHHTDAPRHEKPCILTPITIDRRELVEIASQLPTLFRHDGSEAEIEAGYAFLRASTSALKTNVGGPLTFGNVDYLSSFDYFAANCQLEADTVARLGRPAPSLVSIIPNGVDPGLADWNPGNVELVSEPYLLCVGRIEPNKNQLSLIWALKDVKMNLLLVGDFADDDYGNTCKRIAGERVKFLGQLPTSAVRDLMARAECHLLPSFGETPGLVNLEAAALGCPLVVSNRGGEAEYFGDLVEYCDPLDPESIRRAMTRALKASKTRFRKLRTRVLTEYSWDQVAIATRDLYSAVIEDWKIKNS